MEKTFVIAATNSRIASQILSLTVISWLSRITCLKVTLTSSN